MRGRGCPEDVVHWVPQNYSSLVQGYLGSTGTQGCGEVLGAPVLNLGLDRFLVFRAPLHLSLSPLHDRFFLLGGLHLLLQLFLVQEPIVHPEFIRNLHLSWILMQRLLN